jgi:hypothetical protein
MPANNPFKFNDLHTNRGQVSLAVGHGLAPGHPDSSALVTSGVFTDRETVTVEGDVYEVVDLSTDSTVDVLTFWNNTDQVITQTAIDPADYSFSIGDYVVVESEAAIVINIAVNSATDWDVTFYRGVAGTTIAAHATGTTAIEVQSVTALTAGAITVPAEDMTQAVVLDALAAVIGKDTARGPFESGKIDSNVFGVGNQLAGVLPKITSPDWTLYNLDDLTGLLVSDVVGERGATVAEAGANMAWDSTTTSGGSQPAVSRTELTISRVPTAAEVTAGLMHFKVGGVVLGSPAVDVYTTATGVAVAHDGTVTVVDANNGIISVDNGGLTDWATTDTVVLNYWLTPVPLSSMPAIK